MISPGEERQIWARAFGFLERGRPGDVEHTRTAVARGRILQANDLNVTLVFEADWLDKYGPARRERYLRIFTDQRNLEELDGYLDMNRLQWFRTRTAGELLVKIASCRERCLE